MRDIRPDLKERMALLEEEIKKTEKHLQVLRETRGSTAQTLRDEERRWPETTPFSKAQGNGQRKTPLSEILLGVLTDGKPHHRDELVEVAEESGIPFGSRSPKRVIHGALMGLSKGSLGIKSLGDGRWQKDLTK